MRKGNYHRISKIGGDSRIVTKKLIIVCVLVIGLYFLRLSMFPSNAIAAPIQALTFTGGTPNTGWPGPWFLGWQFQVTKNIEVTHLGVFDVNGGGIQITDGGARNAGLYIYNNNGSSSLLTQATIAVGTPGESAGSYNAHYASIAPINLTPGVNYIIAAQESLYDPDNIYDANISTASGINFITGKAAGWTGNVLQNENFYITRSNSYFGGTFKFADGQPVPEPATLLLLGSGLAGIAVWGKRLGR